MKSSLVSICFLLCLHLRCQTWSTAGFINDQVFGFGEAYGNFYASCFTANSSTTSEVLFEQSGSTWTTVPGSTNSNPTAFVKAIEEYQNQMYIAGHFATFSPPFVAYNMVRELSGTWLALGSGFSQDSYIYDLQQYNNKLYASGIFTAAGGVVTSGIAAWDGNTWAKLGSQGLAGTAFGRCMKTYKNELYIGGNFSGAGGVPVSHIAKWNGSNWFPVGAGISGFNTMVNCMEIYKDELYAAGNFMFAGGDTATGIARWNGTSWDDVSTGFFTSNIFDLEVYQDELYATGDFTAIGGVATEKIAKWNGSSWSALGSGLQLNSSNAFGSALCARPDGLYVGGFFSNAGGIATSNIAKWTMPPSGVKEETINNIRLFPNPADELLHIDFNGKQSATVQIYDHMGRMVFNAGLISDSIIDVSAFAPGIYVLKFEAKAAGGAKRFVVVR